MTPQRLACPKCAKFSIHVTASGFDDNNHNVNGIVEWLQIHCDSCDHDFELRIG